MERFWVLFLSHTAPGFQLWFYFHLCMWAVRWGLLLRLPWRTGFAPVRARRGGRAAAWVTGVPAGPGTQGGWRLGQQEYSALEGYGSQYWPVRSSILAWKTPSLTEKPGRPQSIGLRRAHHPGYVWLQQGLSDPCSISAATDQLFPSQPEMLLL